jgi:hypothetical protein
MCTTLSLVVRSVGGRLDDIWSGWVFDSKV